MDRHRTRQDAFTAEDACQNQAMILNLIRHCGACSEDRPILEVLVNRAIQMEEKNPDDSLALYREALTLGRNHHPDQAPTAPSPMPGACATSRGFSGIA